MRLAHTTPLSSTRFASLPLLPETQRAMSEGFGYEFCSPVQEVVITAALDGSDVLARADAGAGKTLAYLVPALERIRRMGAVPAGQVALLVVIPARELSAQISRSAQLLTCFSSTPLGVLAMKGGDASSLEYEMSLVRMIGLPPVLITTPGRLVKHLHKTPGFMHRFSALRVLVFDQADELFSDPDFARAADEIVSMMPPRRKRQTMMLATTLPERVETLAMRMMRPSPEHRRINCASAKRHGAALPEQYALQCTMAQLLPTLWAALTELTRAPDAKVIVFIPTTHATHLLATVFRNAGMDVRTLHSRLDQAVRDHTAAQFHDAPNGVLFSSDLTSRGLRYPGVSCVLQLGCAPSREMYMSRLGRMDEGGIGLLLLCDFERSFLEHLPGLPLKDWAAHGGVPPTDETPPALSRALERVGNVAASVSGPYAYDGGTLAYRAWLRYYVHLWRARQLSLSPENLVARANEFASSIGLRHPPVLHAHTVDKLGLWGTPGLRVDESDSGRGHRPPSKYDTKVIRSKQNRRQRQTRDRQRTVYSER